MADVVVIGGGPAGYVAAIRAAQKGAFVILIEQEELGGVCLNKGCIPTKALFYSAKSYFDSKNSFKLGVFSDNVSFDFSKIFQRKEMVVSNLKKGLEGLLKKNKIKIIKAKASFVSKSELLVNDEIIKASSIIIATGSKPKKIFEGAIDSYDLLNTKNLPKSLIIIGGGYIGSEFASIFNMLDVKVTIVESEKNILNGFGENISKTLEKNFEKQGMTIFKEAKITYVDKNTVKIDKTILKADLVLSAVGRESNYEGLNVDKIDIAKDNVGIIVDEYMRTNIENIYAIGDVTGRHMLAHVAYEEAEIAVDHIFQGSKKMDYSAIPFVVFTNPQIASCGCLEGEKTVFPFIASGWAHASCRTEGFCQIISKEKKIVGAQVICENASDLILEMVFAIKTKMALEDFVKIIHAHPTASECFKEAALIANKTPLHL